MRIGASKRFLLVAFICWPLFIRAQEHQPTPLPREHSTQDPAEAARGRALFRSSCGFCHGNDATGARGPDLVRSAIVVHDDHGNLLGPFIRNGRPDKGMPSFTAMKDDEIADIVAFLHLQASESLHSNRIPGDYPIARLLTGNARSGKTFFDGPGHCSQCHSVSGDLSGIAKRYSPLALEQRMLNPSARKALKTAVVKLRDGTEFQGEVLHEDEFNIGLKCQDGWYRSWPVADVEIRIDDHLLAHRELMRKYTDADVHNLFAYLETLK